MPSEKPLSGNHKIAYVSVLAMLDILSEGLPLPLETFVRLVRKIQRDAAKTIRKQVRGRIVAKPMEVKP